MNYLAISGLLIFVSSVCSAGMVFLKGKRNNITTTWILFSLTVASWGFGLFQGFNTASYPGALFWGRFLNTSAILIPLFFIHFVLAFANKTKKRKRKLISYYILILTYFITTILFPRLFVQDLKSILGFKYYPTPGYIYYLFPLIFGLLVVDGIVTLFKELLIATPTRRNQIKYLFAGVSVGFLGGSTTFFPVFNIKIPPVGTFLVPLYVVTVSISIVRYQLMDIKIAIGKGLTYLFSSLLVCCAMWISILTINIFSRDIFDIGEILIILGLTFVIYTVCIVLYPRFMVKLETGIREFLYKDRYKYQEKLKEVASNIPTIYDMEKLLRYTLDTTTSAFESSPASIMLLNEITKSYIVEYSTGLPEELSKRITFYPDTEIVQKLRWGNRILIKEESPEDSPTRERMESVKAEISIPIARKDKLIGIINLNHKGNGDIYSHEDLFLVMNIAKYLGMAIENITLSKREHQEELITYLNNIAYALAHELKNKSQTIITTAQAIQSMLPQVTNVPQDLITLANTANDKILEIDSLVNELVAYSNVQQREGFGPVDVNKVLDESLLITDGEIKNKKINVVKKYTESNIKHGDRGQLIQVFVSVIRNSIEAMDDGGILTLNVFDEGEFWKISIEDTGKGIPENHLGSIFEPFFTTKHDHKGLGLSIARRIIYDHAGEIKVESAEGKGTIIYIYLPKQMPEDKLMARAEIKRREDISYDRIKTKDYQDRMKKENQNGQT